MSIWSHVTGVIHLDVSVTEDSLLSIYGLLSHHLVGSEGGLNISFTRTTRKNSFSSSEADYHVEPISRIDNMVIQGHLRDFDEKKLDNGFETLKEYLIELNKRIGIRSASFVLECDASNYYYHLAYTMGRVRSKKVMIK